MTTLHFGVLLILLAGALLSIRLKKLTVWGAIVGGIIGYVVFLGGGLTGIFLLALFFVLGTSATAWKIGMKKELKAEEKNNGKRTAGQVFANGGITGLMGLLSWLNQNNQEPFQLMMAASLASATADTLSSELGTVYGKRFYNIINFRKDRRGENGVVSIEGTLIGIGGSLLIAIVYALGFGWNANLLFVVLGGVIGNLADSILGATLERKNYLQNNAVNFINTIIGALIAHVCSLLF